MEKMNQLKKQLVLLKPIIFLGLLFFGVAFIFWAGYEGIVAKHQPKIETKADGTPVAINAEKSIENSELTPEKIGIISQKLNLTTEQAIEFWPLFQVYYKHTEDLVSLLKKTKNSCHQKSLSDEEYLAYIEKILLIEKDLANYRKEYYLKFKGVLSPKQLALLFGGSNL